MTVPAVPDLLAVDVPVGGRVLVVSDLHLGRYTTSTSATATAELAQAVDAWTGPGLLIFNGSCLELLCAGGTDARAALLAHAALRTAVKAFAAGPGRRVLYLPGARDSRVAWDAAAAGAIGDMLGTEIALAADLTIDTGAGPRVVRVEPGHQLDALTHLDDPRNPGESPLGHHLVCDVLPALRSSTSGRATDDGPAGGAQLPEADGWLSGLESLDDPASFPRFLASRLTYRRLGRHAWVLLLPVIAAALLRLPFAAMRTAHQHVASAARVTLFMGLATAVGLILVGTVVALMVRGTWRGLAGVALRQASDDARSDRNAAARARARQLVTSGHAGLVTGSTRRPELTYLGDGFYANSGCASDVVTESPARLHALGAPSLFLAQRQVSWVELEAGSELHVRLLHSRKDLGGATILERLLTQSGPERVPAANDSQPVLVATFPHGTSWPAPVSVDRRLRRVRRWSAALVAAAGVLSLMSAFLAPTRQRLSSLLQFVPLAVPQAADALVALASLGLLALARSIRRGQRRAWLIACTLLAGTFLLHLVKGFDVEEAIATGAVFGYLFVHRDAFQAGVDKPSTRRGVLTLLWGAALTIAFGTAAVELGTRLAASRHHQRLPLPRAFLAATERLVGVRSVRLPDRLDDFFAPAMVAIAIGLGLAVAYLLSRPVVAHRAASPAAGGVPAGVNLGAGGLGRARDVVRRYGSGTLDYFALRPDKEFFFWGDSVVAYGIYGGVCLVSPDPIGPRAEREEVWKAFRRFADRSGWTLTVLGAGEDWLPVYRAAGMHDLYVGDEAVVDCGRFTLDGGRFKGLRQAVNRVAKYGYTITFHDPATIDVALRRQLEGVMTKSRRGDFERGFSMTLGRAFDASDDGLLLAVVWGPAGADGEAEPVAFCQYVPAPGINGYSLDLMRRDSGEHPNGLLDFAIVETIRYLKAQGKTGLGLNFATMRAVLAGEAGDGLSQRIQAWLLRRMSDSMQIESLWKFNAKFDPDWLPRYALYDSPEHALPCAIAVARAESFWELPVIGRFLVPSTPAPTGTAAPATGTRAPEPAPAAISASPDR
ncbi:MAG TPA: phosphatidylglycerol lysyltransferase domain-containing protein [Acidimicrobiales bacterium]|nr:phosphatidylglycerol lysyltransferase domain-containing protein [Acidimicrobiales bacterium]